MSIITISRGSYSMGQEVGQKVAERLGYTCITRDVLLETSKEFNIPEVKLVRAIHDAPGILNRFTYGKEKYIAFIQAAILRQLKEGYAVYCGLAGHFFVRGVPNVLKVRILADFEDRVENEMKREGISGKEAARILLKDDEERRKWSQYLYGIDTRDPALYDLVVHIKSISVDNAVDIICETAALDAFQFTSESEKMLADLALAAEVRAALIDMKPDVLVTASGGTVAVKTTGIGSTEGGLEKEIKRIAGDIPGVKDVRVKVKLKDRVD